MSRDWARSGSCGLPVVAFAEGLEFLVVDVELEAGEGVEVKLGGAEGLAVSGEFAVGE